MKDTNKVTLTLEQLKKLISESRKPIILWDVFTDDLDGVDKTCQSLYNIVDACKEDNSNYQKQHRKTVEWLGKYVGAEFGPKEALNVTRHFVGLFVDPNDWPPCLMFDNEKAANTVACTLAQGTHLYPEDLYSRQTEWDDDVEESRRINEWEEYVDDDGYSHDDEGNVEYVGKGWSGGVYGLHDGPHGSGYYGRRHSFTPVEKDPKDKFLKPTKDGECPKCGRKLVKRNGKFGEFYSCPGFPRCSYSCNKQKYDAAVKK